MDNDNGVPAHTHSEYVSQKLCMESRAHTDTKIENMGSSIRWSIYLASAVLGVATMLFQWYLAVTVR